MRNTVAFEDEKNDPRTSSFCWWRSCEELDEKVVTPSRLELLREMERLALIAPESLDDLRHRLYSYHPGDLYIPTGGIEKEDLQIPPLITILLVGFRGAGKSSLINLMYSVLGRTGLIPFAQTSGSSEHHSTMCLEEHNVLRSASNGFCVFDSRGLDYEKMVESFDGLFQWMEDGVRHHQECRREGDEDEPNGEAPGLCWFESSKYAKRTVNCVFVVANMAEICGAVKDGNKKPLEATKSLFTCPAINKYENPILILTQGDELSADERLQGRLMICEFLGISATTGAYDIACVTEHGILTNESDPVTAYALAEAVYRALLFSDRTHPTKRNFKDWLLICISTLVFFMANFFAFLADVLSNLEKKTGKLKH